MKNLNLHQFQQVNSGLVWYNCPPIQEWAAMTFLMRIYWLVWLIGLAAVVYLGVLVLLGVRKHHLLTKH